MTLNQSKEGLGACIFAGARANPLTYCENRKFFYLAFLLDISSIPVYLAYDSLETRF